METGPGLGPAPPAHLRGLPALPAARARGRARGHVWQGQGPGRAGSARRAALGAFVPVTTLRGKQKHNNPTKPRGEIRLENKRGCQGAGGGGGWRQEVCAARSPWRAARCSCARPPARPAQPAPRRPAEPGTSRAVFGPRPPRAGGRSFPSVSQRQQEKICAALNLQLNTGEPPLGPPVFMSLTRNTLCSLLLLLFYLEGGS